MMEIELLIGQYPMEKEALDWYQGAHCPRCKTFLTLPDPYGFQNGWDSAIRTVLKIMEKQDEHATNNSRELETHES